MPPDSSRVNWRKAAALPVIRSGWFLVAIKTRSLVSFQTTCDFAPQHNPRINDRFC
jgi:hypothetical protein